jgi:hypothetical protein
MDAMTGHPECHITSCRETGTVRLAGRCASGHVMDDLFCAPDGANHGRLLCEGELNCTRCYDAGEYPSNLFPFTEIMPEPAVSAP